ncbi:hypothetical protein ACFO26_02910 [Lactococcus nasutitermitis]|uniref:Phage protein n=1 Tax=Lactococcus nasutitermitis TaxID=1652957 RepID=A0ABV9JBR3_9LACT|nr:hypothetical protein [Lactococcus nasutitermitis]
MRKQLTDTIITVCDYIAGVDSLGMRELKAEHENLSEQEIKARDSLNRDFQTVHEHHRHSKMGVLYEDEKEK